MLAQHGLEVGWVDLHLLFLPSLASQRQPTILLWMNLINAEAISGRLNNRGLAGLLNWTGEIHYWKSQRWLLYWYKEKKSLFIEVKHSCATLWRLIERMTVIMQFPIVWQKKKHGENLCVRTFLKNMPEIELALSLVLCFFHCRDKWL